ncbi:hypothetical protein DFH06DRAFT_1239387 [Mycena polygramma]|nr:hypothetical protein DFH06DRAFT_1239387 [Mycena polygramma]
MHPALQIAEIVYLVCGTFLTEDRDARKTLAALAVTCKSLHNPSLDVLWRTQWSIIPLLSCLPGDAFDIRPLSASGDTPPRLQRFISAADWDRALLYSTRVRHFSLRHHAGLAPTLEALNLLLPVGFLYPNLENVTWSSQEELPYIRIFLSPRILSIRLDFGPDILTCSFISILGRFCPNLKNIAISFDDDNWSVTQYTAKVAVSDLLCSLRHLDLIEVPMLDQRTLQYISGLPTLASLHLGLLHDFVVPTSLPQAYFPGLRHLTVDFVDIDQLVDLFRSAIHMQLRSVHFVFEDYFSTVEMERFYTALAESCSHETLESITLLTEGGRADRISGPGAVEFVVNDRLLQILTCFRNISTLRITSDIEFDVCDSTLADVARAWPRLTIFELRECLTELCVGNSPISNPNAVARLLSDVFPNLRKITHSTLWGPTPTGWDTPFRDWATVQAALPEFVAARREERARARA